MRHSLLFALFIVLCPAWAPNASIAAEAHATLHGDADFAGWQSLEVIKLEDGRQQRGLPSSHAQLRFGDVNGDGRQNMLVIQRRQSLIEWYSYVPASKRRAAAQQEDVNALPLSARFEKKEFRLERLPRDVVVLGPRRLAVLVGPPNHIEIYAYTDAGTWELDYALPLLAGEPAHYLRMLYVASRNELLIPTDNGTQIVTLGEQPRLAWMRPREAGAAWKWFLSDLDGDGDEDLIKTYGSAMESIVWHRNENGFRPPQAIYEQKIRDAIILENTDAASDIILIDAIGSSLLRRYQLKPEKEQRFGLRRALSLPSDQAAWAGVRLGDQAALVVIDAEHPQFLVSVYEGGDWKQSISFPCIDKVEAIFAPQSQPGCLLLKRKGDAELYKSEWAAGRFSFPQPWQPAAHQAKDVKLLQIGRVADTLWWTQKQDADIVLFTWDKASDAPVQTIFKNQGKKVEAASWLGGQRLLVKDSFKRDGRIVVFTAADQPVRVVEAAHLKNINLDEYRVHVNQAGQVQAQRLHNGVLQWLDDDLHAQDQIMLEDGLRVSDYVRIGQEQFVLEAESMHLVQLEKDASGVMRRAQQYDLPGGYSLHQDPVLALFVQESGWICRLDRGQAWTLQALEHIDERLLRPAGVKELSFDRLFPVQVDAQRRQGLIVSDDGRHRLSLFARTENETRALASWQVFEDNTYPYGAPQERHKQREPQVVVSQCFDDDEIPDLILKCHDRILLYLSQKN